MTQETPSTGGNNKVFERKKKYGGPKLSRDLYYIFLGWRVLKSKKRLISIYAV